MANKNTTQKKTDPEMAALKDAWDSGAQTKEAEIVKLKEKLEVAPWIFEMAGKIKTLAFNEAQSRFFKLVLLKQVKDNKEYREKFGMTWEQFCEHVCPNVTRRWIDEQLADLKPFKTEFLELFFHFSGVDFHKIKYLGQSVLEQTSEIKGNKIIYQGEEIPVTPEHAEDIQALLENLEESYNAQIEEQTASLRTKDKLIKAKEDVIHKQEKSLRKFEKDAQHKGLTLEEDAFLQGMSNMKTSFDGFYMLNVDPDRIEELKDKPTPRMISAYISTLQYMRMQINAAYDTAVETYGDPAMLPEEDWWAKKGNGEQSSTPLKRGKN